MKTLWFIPYPITYRNTSGTECLSTYLLRGRFLSDRKYRPRGILHEPCLAILQRSTTRSLATQRSMTAPGQWFRCPMVWSICLPKPADASTIKARHGIANTLLPTINWKERNCSCISKPSWGKSKVWINGKLVNEHFGGFLPVIADITPYIQFGQDNVIAVCADNSDDPSYPPGKPQDVCRLLLLWRYLPRLLADCS